MTILKSHLHSGTAGVAVTNPATEGYSAITGATPSYYSNGLRWLASNGFGNLEDNGVSGLACLSTYVLFETLPTGNINIMDVRTSALATIGSIQIASDGTVRVRDGANILRNTTVPMTGLIAANTEYRIELWFNAASGQQCRVYAGDSTTPLADSGLITASAGVPNGARVGSIANPLASPIHRQVQLGDTWTGPWPTAGGGGTRTGRPKVRVAGSWVNKPAKVFIGGSWVEKPVKIYDVGTGTWVLAR